MEGRNELAKSKEYLKHLKVLDELPHKCISVTVELIPWSAFKSTYLHQQNTRHLMKVNFSGAEVLVPSFALVLIKTPKIRGSPKYNYECIEP